MSQLDIVDRASVILEGVLHESVLVRGKTWSIRHLENGQVFSIKRHSSENAARAAWDIVKKGYAGGSK